MSGCAAAVRELDAAPRITAGLVTFALAASLVSLLLARVRRLPEHCSRLGSQGYQAATCQSIHFATRGSRCAGMVQGTRDWLSDAHQYSAVGLS